MDETDTEARSKDRPLDRRVLGWLFVGLTAVQIVYMLRAMGVEAYALRAAVRRAVQRYRPRDVTAEARAGLVEIERYLERAARR